MRHTGKTTRLVDEAIQYLFTHGTLWILPDSALNNPKGYTESIIGSPQNKRECLLHFIDDSQRYLIEVLKRRLSFEHSTKVNVIYSSIVKFTINE